MPCYDPETHDRPERLEKKVHKLTAMLCWLCGKLEKQNPDFAVTQEIQEWWRLHKEVDSKIESIKAKRNSTGWNSLTPDEQRILNIGEDASR